MERNYEPIIHHEDEEVDQPDRFHPDNQPEPLVEADDSPMKYVHAVIISIILELLESARVGSPSLWENPGFETKSISSSSKVMASTSVPSPSGQLLGKLTVDNGNKGEDVTFPHKDAKKGSSLGKEESGVLAYLEYLWKYKGGALCRFASTEKYAGFMVEKYVLEMILANLQVSRPSKITEMCLKILNNLISRESIGQRVASTDGLIKAVVEQLFLDDVPCLCETLWLLMLGLHGSECLAWVRALLPARITRRLFWITEKASRESEILLGRVVGLFLTILQHENGVLGILIPRLIGHGLEELLIHALTNETGQLYSNSTNPERMATIDVTLRALEALSCLEDHSHRLSFNKELIFVISSLFREARIPAVVLLAKALADEPHHATHLSRVVITRNDSEAVRNVLSHILVHINEREMGSTSFLQYVSLLANKSDTIVQILCRWTDAPSEHHGSSSSQSTKATITSLHCIINILKEWTRSNGNSKRREAEGRDVRRLLECCEKHLQDMTGNCQ